MSIRALLGAGQTREGHPHIGTRVILADPAMAERKPVPLLDADAEVMERRWFELAAV
jgi:hypothetical protein